MNFIIIQAIGFVGLMFVVASFQKDRRSFTLILQLLAALAFTVHFSLLGAWTGAAMNGLSAATAYVFYLRDSRRWLNNKGVMYLFIIFFWVAGLLTWEGYISLLPVISMTLECFALWSSRTRHIRWLFLSARPAWIAYDLIVSSYAGLATEAFIVSSLFIAIIRFDILKRENSETTNRK